MNIKCQGCARFAEFWLKKFEFRILCSLSSVDFHTLTLQLPIQTQNSVVPELQVSLEISAKQAHPRRKRIGFIFDHFYRRHGQETVCSCSGEK